MADVQISVTEADVQIAVIDQENTQLALAAPDDNQVNIAVPGVQGAPGTVNAAADGTVTQPGISFASDTDVGLYRPAANTLGITVGGVLRMSVGGNRIRIPEINQLQITDSTTDAAGLQLIGSSSAASTIGTLSAQPLIFRTNSTERFRIDSAGRLGIGTNAPGNTLEVVGNLSNGLEGKGTINITSNTTTNNGFDASPSIGFSAPYSTGSPRILYGAVAAGKTNSNSGNTAGYLSFYTSPASSTGVVERVRITDTGRVGIGTTGPGELLHVSGNISLRTSAFTSNGYLEFGDSGTPYSRVGRLASSGGLFLGTIAGNASTTLQAAGDVIFNTNGATERARFDASGRLLVGTSASRDRFFNVANLHPGIQLEGTAFSGRAISVVSDSNTAAGDAAALILGRQRSGTNTGYTLVANNDTLGGIYFQGGDGAEFVAGAQIDAQVDGSPGANDMPGRLVFGTTSDGAASPTERMRIDSSGRLLVGTTSAVNNANIQAATSVSVGGLTKREFAKSLSLTDNTSTTVFTFAIPGGSSQTSFTGVGGEISYIVFVGRETSTRNARATYGKVQFAISRFWESSANNPVAVNIVSTNQSLVTSNGAAPTITWAITTDAGIDSAAKNVYIAITVDNPFTNLLSTSFEGTISYHTRSFADVTLT